MKHVELVLLFVLAGVSAGCFLGGFTEDPGVPTIEAERRDFVQRVTAEGVLRAKESTRVSVPQDVERTVRLAWIVPDGTRVEAGDLVARFDELAMREKLEDGRADRAKADLQLEKAAMESRAEMADLEISLETAEIELDHAERFKRSDTDVFSRRDVLEDAIDGELARDRKNHALASIGTRESQAAAQRDLLAIEKRKAELEIEQAESGLRALEVRSPHAGIVTLVRNWNGEPARVGSEMWRGQALAEIPELHTMEAEVYVLEADAGGLAVGKRAEVIVEAHPDTVHDATIARVEPLAKPRFRGSPVQYFSVVLALESTDPETMKPGQRVRATLELDRRDDAIVIPRQALFDLAEGDEGSQAVTSGDAGENASRVWVREGDEFEPRRVALGPVSMGLAVVESGLEAGEVVALAEPGSLRGDKSGKGAGGGPALAAGG